MIIEKRRRGGSGVVDSGAEHTSLVRVKYGQLVLHAAGREQKKEQGEGAAATRRKRGREARQPQAKDPRRWVGWGECVGDWLSGRVE